MEILIQVRNAFQQAPKKHRLLFSAFAKSKAIGGYVSPSKNIYTEWIYCNSDSAAHCFFCFIVATDDKNWLGFLSDFGKQ